MDITEFFEQSAGKWFSQRTDHHPTLQKIDAGKGNLQIDFLSHTDPEAIAACEEYGVDPSLLLCGNRIAWDGTIATDPKKQVGSTVLVALAEGEDTRSGKILRLRRSPQKQLVAGRYFLGNDDILTLITEVETTYTEDRLWFASANLRLRTSIGKRGDRFRCASLYSEIRMGLTSPSKT